MMIMGKSVEKALFEITPEIQHFAEICEEKNAIEKRQYGTCAKLCRIL